MGGIVVARWRPYLPIHEAQLVASHPNAHL
jgi:hypothetical protein